MKCSCQDGSWVSGEGLGREPGTLVKEVGTDGEMGDRATECLKLNHE